MSRIAPSHPSDSKLPPGREAEHLEGRLVPDEALRLLRDLERELLRVSQAIEAWIRVERPPAEDHDPLRLGRRLSLDGVEPAREEGELALRRGGERGDVGGEDERLGEAIDRHEENVHSREALRAPRPCACFVTVSGIGPGL